METSLVVCVVLLAVSAVYCEFPYGWDANLDAPSPVNFECMISKCSKSSAGCLLNEKCRAAIACASKCWKEWDSDTTSEKYHVQNCTNICAFSYREKAYEDFMNCVGDNNCVQFLPIPSRCKAPGNITILKKLSTMDLKGDWWVIGGRHPVYDCYPCQHIIVEPLNATTWKYLPKYYVYLANGSLGLMNDLYYIPNTAPGSPISFVYHDLGLYHNETWYLVDGAEDGSYILIYYCGNTLQWFYDGFLIISRERTLPDSVMPAIGDSIKTTTGLDFTTFCRTQTAGCTD